MKNKSIEKGWVVVSPYNGILEHTYHILSGLSKNLFLDKYEGIYTWSDYAKEGYKCVQAKRTIEIE